MRERTVVTFVLVLAMYEWLAIYLRCWPTVTALIRPHRDVTWVFWTGIAIHVLVATASAIHLFGERGGW